MGTVVILASVTLIVLAAMAVQAGQHRHAVRGIRWRIHVNGTRGKSTLVRLIAAGLRAGGLRVVAKTTGSAARVILEDGRELSIDRPRHPTITEQRRFAAWAARRGVDAVVVECMAVRPDYQVMSDAFVQSNIGVITNVRPDHLEEAGANLVCVARAYAAAVPRHGTVVTAEQAFLDTIEAGASARGSQVIAVPAPADADARMPFPENLALAAEVCRIAGVKPKVATRGMGGARPDAGALGVFKVVVDGITCTCVNAFAANDPVSAGIICQWLVKQGLITRPPVLIYNHRADRPERAVQFATFIDTLDHAAVLLIGDSSAELALRPGKAVVQSLQRLAAGEVTAAAVRLAGDGGSIVGLGNIGGPGMRLVQYWEDKSKRDSLPDDRNHPLRLGGDHFLDESGDQGCGRRDHLTHSRRYGEFEV